MIKLQNWLYKTTVERQRQSKRKLTQYQQLHLAVGWYVYIASSRQLQNEHIFCHKHTQRRSRMYLQSKSAQHMTTLLIEGQQLSQVFVIALNLVLCTCSVDVTNHLPLILLITKKRKHNWLSSARKLTLMCLSRTNPTRISSLKGKVKNVTK